MDFSNQNNPRIESGDSSINASLEVRQNSTPDTQLSLASTSSSDRFFREIIPFNDDVAQGRSYNNSSETLENSSFCLSATAVAREEMLSWLASNQSQQPFETHEVLTIRNALKLSTKFFSDSCLPWTAECARPSCSHVAEVGIILALTGAEHEVIEAGLLYPTYRHESIESIKEKGVLERKFSPSVTQLIAEITELLTVSPEELGEKLHEIYQKDELAAHRLATLHCAIMSARAEKSSTHHHAEVLTPVYYSLGVSLDLINQYNAFTGCAGDIYPSNQSTSNYSLHEIIDIRKALRLASVVYKDALRKWGPEEKIPLISHAAEVGLLLALAGKSRNVVVAGLLHDFLEGYVSDEISDLGKELGAYGEEVFNLVQEITEPQRREVQGKPETLEAWRKRKHAIVERLESGSTDFADLCAATKISTIAAGNKMLFENGSFAKWSNGPIDDNLAIFITINEVCSAKGVSPLLADQLDIETDRLILQSIGANSKLAEVA
jgi:hypothetical protein